MRKNKPNQKLLEQLAKLADTSPSEFVLHEIRRMAKDAKFLIDNNYLIIHQNKLRDGI